MQPILDRVPESNLSEPLFDQLVIATARDQTVGARSDGYVVLDALRKGIRALEQHPHLATKLPDVDVTSIRIDAVDQDRAVDRHVERVVVHPVDRTEQRGLPAA